MPLLEVISAYEGFSGNVLEGGAQLSGLIQKYLIRKKSTIFVQRL